MHLYIVLVYQQDCFVKLLIVLPAWEYTSPCLIASLGNNTTAVYVFDVSLIILSYIDCVTYKQIWFQICSSKIGYFTKHSEQQFLLLWLYSCTLPFSTIPLSKHLLADLMENLLGYLKKLELVSRTVVILNPCVCVWNVCVWLWSSHLVGYFSQHFMSGVGINVHMHLKNT